MTQREPARKVRRYGAWRALSAGPVMLGGLAVMVLVAGPLGAWAPAVPLTWFALAGLWLTGGGERVAVRVAYRYRRLTGSERAVLAPAVDVAESRTQISAGSVDLYVRAGPRDINAFAAGRRSIAVTEGLLAAVEQERLTAAQAGGLLAHEIGHLRICSTRYGLAIAWLSAPWRAVVGVLGGMLRLIVGKVPTARAGLVVLGPIVLAVAAIQGVQQQAWVPLAAMLLAGVLLVVQPLADAALSRAGERAADSYAVACGLGPELADALRSFTSPGAGQRHTAWASHPSRDRRIRELAAASTTARVAGA